MKSDRMFNTNNDDEGDEILTHRGKSLADLERMESPVEVRFWKIMSLFPNYKVHSDSNGDIFKTNF